jgi:hypothetical protein
MKTVSFPVEHTVEKRFHGGVFFAHFKENAKQAKISPTRAYSISFYFVMNDTRMFTNRIIPNSAWYKFHNDSLHG